MTESVVRPLADAFLQVGVYVAVMVAGFGFLQLKYGDRITETLARHSRLGVLVAALLGVSPGCGGAIIVMPLYVRGKVSFGAVVAALTATMGDSSWIVIAADPVFALRIHLLLLAAGLVTGYVVDLLGISPGRERRADLEPAPQPGPAVLGGEAKPLVVAARARPDMSGAFWGLATPAFLLSAPVVFHAVDPAALRPEALGGLDLYLLLGASGTLLALLMLVLRRFRTRGESRDPRELGVPPDPGDPRSVRGVLRHSADEASFITVWVAVAYLGWELVSRASGFDGSQLMLAGVFGVLAGALVGLIPGCAVQIVFTGLYVAGGVPLPALVANAVSQDGDALIPLAALRRRAAVLAALVTTVPAILIGLAVLAIGL